MLKKNQHNFWCIQPDKSSLMTKFSMAVKTHTHTYTVINGNATDLLPKRADKEYLTQKGTIKIKCCLHFKRYFISSFLVGHV